MLTVATLKRAAHRVLADLVHVGSRNGYLWPHGSTFRAHRGYSYVLPKEEQIRCALAAALQTRGRAIELEWNWYEEPRARECGEIDLAIFDDESRVPQHFIETKRIYDLKKWTNKPAEQLRGVENDLDRLRRVRAALGKATGTRPTGLFGVFVVEFKHAGRNGYDLDEIAPEARALSIPDEASFVDFEGKANVCVRALWLPAADPPA